MGAHWGGGQDKELAPSGQKILKTCSSININIILVVLLSLLGILHLRIFLILPPP